MSYFEIGIYQPRNETNIGTLWRSAYQLGAAGIFVIGRQPRRQPADTARTMLHIPLRHFLTFEEFLQARPVGAQLVGVEIGGTPLAGFHHPQQAIYLLGAEDSGLPARILAQCNQVIAVEAVRKSSYNVAVTAAIVMYHLQFIIITS
jgi:tRNA G18 (ribose-2'-O)-methylase SpoU